MIEDLKVKTVIVRGILCFIGNEESNFHGPIRKGFRPIVWLSKRNRESTSCSIISDVEIKKGENMEIQVVILNELQLKRKIVKGMILNLGSTAHKIGEFRVLEHLGLWTGGKVF